MVDIPEGVTVTIDGLNVTAKGPAGTVQKTFSKIVTIKVDGSSVTVVGENYAYIGTVKSIISSMCKGVKDGFEKKLKILHAHFPISVEIKGKEISVKNFLGEKVPRKTKIIGDSTKVTVKGQQITVSGPDKESVGQTAANLIEVTKIKKKDPRVFQDGIYLEV